MQKSAAIMKVDITTIIELRIALRTVLLHGALEFVPSHDDLEEVLATEALHYVLIGWQAEVRSQGLYGDHLSGRTLHCFVNDTEPADRDRRPNLVIRDHSGISHECVC